MGLRNRSFHIADLITLLALALAALLAGWIGYRAPRAADLPMTTPSAVLAARSFNDLEWLPDGRRFRWTSGQSRLGLPNPGGAVRLRLRLLDGPGGGTPLTIVAPGAALDFRLLPGLRRYDILLPPSPAERVELVLASPTADLAGRTIGVGLADLRAAGGGTPPIAALPPLALAAAGCYALLRRAAYRPRSAAGLALALLAGAGLWLHTGGWQYALLGRALLPLGAGGLVAAALDLLPPRGAGRGARGDPGVSVVGGRWSLVGMLALLALALALRVPWLLAPDPTGDLELAARRMYYLYTEGLAGAYRRGGDYMPLRLYYLWAAGHVVGAAGASFAEPIAPLTMLLVKLPQLLADLATVVLIYAFGLVKHSSGEHEAGRGKHEAGRGKHEAGSGKHEAEGDDMLQRSTASCSTASCSTASCSTASRSAFLLAAMYTAAPPVWMNSAWWGQVDAWLMLPMLGAVLLLGRHVRWGWACWALALLIKTQAIIIAPLLYVATLRRHGARGLVAGAAAAGAALAAGFAPLAIAGQGFGMAEAYLGAVGRFPRTSYGAYNLWFLALGGKTVNDFDAALGPLSYRQLGLGLLAAAVLLVCVALWRRSDASGRAEAAAALALAFFVLPTQMHARYLFLPLAFLAVAACAHRRLARPFVALAVSATVNILGVLSGFWPAATAAINASPLPLVCAAVNILALVALLAWLYKGEGQGGQSPP